ncbi:class I SAM-dependent methyltransferase [Streptomyces sp. NPDC054770]
MTVQHDKSPESAFPVEALNYLPTMTIGTYLSTVAATHPLLSSLLDLGRPGTEAALAALADTVTEFDSDGTGRGDSYRKAQRNTMVRWTGIRQILGLLAPQRSGAATVLDVLGGDGTIARALATAADPVLSGLCVVTGDVSGTMVERALEHGLPAVRQSADFLFLRDDAVDAVLLAYGTHHISPVDRPAAIAEAARVVRADGQVLVHDFDETSPMARFFTEVVHPYSTAGHDYRHFSRAHLTELFDHAGIPAQLVDFYDPLTVVADSAEEARQGMCDYIQEMYGIHKFFAEYENAEAAWHSLEQYFDHAAYLGAVNRRGDFRSSPTIYAAGNRFVAEVPRVALLAVGPKGSAWQRPTQ